MINGHDSGIKNVDYKESDVWIFKDFMNVTGSSLICVQRPVMNVKR